MLDYWNEAYRYIHRANKVIENCGPNSPLNENVKNQLKGEAYFIRAYWYLNLVNLFGDILLPTTSDYNTNTLLDRSPSDKVYAQSIQDLTTALQLINTDYVNADNTAGSTERTRPNKAAVLALLARAYLYSGNFAEAESAASQLINNATYGLETVEKAFLIGSKEAIWQLSLPWPNPMSINTQEGAYFILENTPANSEQTALSNETVSAFEKGDLRRKSWVGVYVDSAASSPESYYYANKFKVKRSIEPKEYTMMLRLAEQYLIRAEARIQLGKYPQAIQDLNVIRRRAGVPLYNAANIMFTREKLIQLILKERQLELFAEHGHRWFDMKRLGACDIVMNEVASSRNLHWKPTYKLLPLPQSELALKPYIQQNPGY